MGFVGFFGGDRGEATGKWLFYFTPKQQMGLKLPPEKPSDHYFDSVFVRQFTASLASSEVCSFSVHYLLVVC